MKSLRKAVILAAGHGTRLMPLTANYPKVMLPVRGQPLIEHHLDWLRGYGIEEVYLNLHAQADIIRSHLGEGSRWGIRISYNVEPELRGTAGALHGFRHLLTERFLLHYGDVYSELAVDQMVEMHIASGAMATLAVHPTSHAEDSDIVQVDSSDRVVAVHHKPGNSEFGNLGNAASYVLEPPVCDYLDAGKAQQDFVQDVFPQMLLAHCPLQAFHNRNLVFDMGTPLRYMQLEERLGGR